MKKATKEIKQEPLEKQLWKAADKLRKNIDAAEYKHVVLRLMKGPYPPKPPAKAVSAKT